MKRLVVAGVVSAVFLVAGCSSGNSITGSAISVTIAPTTVDAGPSLAPPPRVAPSTSAPKAAATETATEPATTAATDSITPAVPASVSAPPVATGIVQVSVTVGKDDSPTRVNKVPLGATVQLALLNPTADDEFHLHGYDIEQKGKAGGQGIISFVADKRGSFTLENHLDGRVLLTLVVA